MRVTQLAILGVLAAIATFSPSNSFPMAEVISAHETTPAVSAVHMAKIASKLLEAVQDDPAVEANIMVQLESPDAVMRRVCGQDGDDATTRAQKTTCMVDNMQQFADQSQQQVKDLLAQHTDEHAEAIFFWINNSVAVKKAKGSLVLALSALDTVLTIRSEQIFHTMDGTGKGKETAKDQASTTFGFNVIH